MSEPFDLIRRKILAELWSEADRIVHGEAVCLYRICPHSIDLEDLMVAIGRVMPPPNEDTRPPAALSN